MTSGSMGLTTGHFVREGSAIAFLDVFYGFSPDVIVLFHVVTVHTITAAAIAKIGETLTV